MVPIPPNLDTEAFRGAWEIYLGHHRDLTQKRLTAGALKVKLRKLGALGPKEATNRLEQAVSNGWRGIRGVDFADTRLATMRPSTDDVPELTEAGVGALLDDWIGDRVGGLK